jgi:glycosyltransferase involved in cell wall biosynthesis
MDNHTEPRTYPSLSVFFPAHNEVDNIGALAEKTVKVLEKNSLEDFEVIIVNDGSADGTRELAEELAAKHPKVRAVHHEVNRGYGAAVWTGIRSCRMDYLFFTDGDGQFDVEEIDLFLPHMAEYDALLGFRIKRADPAHRKLFGWGWTHMVIRPFLGIAVRDLDCAFKLFRRDLFDDIEQEAGGAMVTAEILAKLKKKGFTYREIGVHHYPRTAGEQSGGSPKVILRAFKELFGLWRKLR